MHLEVRPPKMPGSGIQLQVVRGSLQASASRKDVTIIVLSYF